MPLLYVIVKYLDTFFERTQNLFMKPTIRFTILLSSVTLSLLFARTAANAGLNIEAFGGLSGTSAVIAFIDSSTESNGELNDAASESGLMCGEFGLAMSLSGGPFGIRGEGLYGKYRYYALSSPSPAYNMLMWGVEPFIKSDSLWIGGGYGRFTGTAWIDYVGYIQKVKGSHSGWAAWGATGIYSDYFDFSVRLRYHKFTELSWTKDVSRDLDHDWVIVVRMTFRVPLF